jgi:flagellar L-ring protein FlgH
MNGMPARTVIIGGIAALALAALATDAHAQSGSLYKKAAGQRPWTAKDSSFIYQEIEPPKEFRVHDIVTVLVDENTRVLSDGEMEGKKKADGSMTLSDWIGIHGWSIRPDPQTTGDPTVAGKVENKYKAEGELETRESLKLTLTCTVVDIRPNGHLVLEGHQSIHVNNEQWDISLGGMIRAEDVLPNNTVMSEDVAELRLIKRETGHVRDRYRRGWFQKWIDKYQPF